MSVLKQKFIFVSDMHYTTDKSAEELALEYPNAKASMASGVAFGKSQGEKVQKIYDDVIAESKLAPIDGVLVLGDLSIDDYDYRQLPENYCQKFKDECMDRLPCPAYAIAGNHDSYTNEQWREVFGYERQYCVEIGDSVFIMADTFALCPASSASGSPHTRLDGDFLESALNKYKGKKIFLCSHYFHADETFDERTKRLIRESKDIVCLFRGHVHINSITELGKEFGFKKLIDIGGYGYSGCQVGDRWDFSIFNYDWAWGYQVLEIYDDKIRVYHVRTKNLYIASNGVFDVEKTISDEVEYSI